MDNNDMTAYRQQFLNSCEEKLKLSQMIRQCPSSYLTLAANQEIFSQNAAGYTESFANPAYLHQLGFLEAGFLSILYQFFSSSLRDVILERPILVWDKSDLLEAIRTYFKDDDIVRLQKTFDEYGLKTQSIAEETRMRESADLHNPFAKILSVAQPDQLDWMAGYGIPISQTEQEYCRFWFSLPARTLNKIAKHIANAFMHGFISQSRNIAGRNLVRLTYAVGQEALAKETVNELNKHGMQTILLSPSCSGYHEQYLADHHFDQAAYLDERCYSGQTQAYQAAADMYRGQLLNTCGFIRIGSFGKATTPVVPSPHAYRPNTEQAKHYRTQLMNRRNIETSFLKPDTLSFCSVVFPDMNIGTRFDEIFQSFVHINTEDPKPHELIQKALIDLLDTCQSVHLKGFNGNQTELTVQLQLLTDPQEQTNFLNCGGDLNIPHGEIFTTPQLTGTTGLLHVKEVYLKDHFYRDLKLHFADGQVTDYSCENTPNSEYNRQYVFENLLQSTNHVPMGELAIGTNTLAYQTANTYGIYNRLPILLAEKMGPHIAIGDPCFARGEDSPVYNLYGGKEMVARENELTRKRREKPDCYVNFHTDITIPYHEMGLFEGIQKDGTRVTIIQNGRFVPPEAAALNRYLEDM